MEKTRFVHEAQAAAALDHPNICTIHEIGSVVISEQKSSGRLEANNAVSVFSAKEVFAL